MIWWEGFLGNFGFIWVLTGFTIILCGIYIALLLYFPGQMNFAMPIAGGLVISTFGVNLIFYHTRFFINFNRVMLGIFLFIIGALMLLCCWFYRKQIQVHGMFMEHAARLIKAVMKIHAYIFIYIVFSLLLMALSFYEFMAVWTAQPPIFIRT